MQRQMRRLEIRGTIRSKGVKTSVPDKARACPQDRGDRQFRAERPNPLQVSDFTYVSTWTGFVYVAFVVDVFARRIVGWRVPASSRTALLLDALEQALRARRPAQGGLIQSIGMLVAMGRVRTAWARKAEKPPTREGGFPYFFRTGRKSGN
jgi:putative transposase